MLLLFFFLILSLSEKCWISNKTRSKSKLLSRLIKEMRAKMSGARRWIFRAEIFPWISYALLKCCQTTKQYFKHFYLILLITAIIWIPWFFKTFCACDKKLDPIVKCFAFDLIASSGSNLYEKWISKKSRLQKNIFGMHVVIGHELWNASNISMNRSSEVTMYTLNSSLIIQKIDYCNV